MCIAMTRLVVSTAVHATILVTVFIQCHVAMRNMAIVWQFGSSVVYNIAQSLFLLLYAA